MYETQNGRDYEQGDTHAIGSARKPRRPRAMSTAIVWFRRDLRLADNPALDAALRAHSGIVCAYVHAPQEDAPWQPGAASRWWLHHSLAALDADLRRRGSRLVIRCGPTQSVLPALARESQAQAVYWNRLYEPAAAARDAGVAAMLRDLGLDTHSSNANLLVEPWEIANAQGGPYRVFTPFWRTAHARLAPRPPIPVPRRIPAAALPDGAPIESLRLRPRIHWDAEFPGHWRPGEAGAAERLLRFPAEALDGYARERDLPGRDGTSRLSPHLHFGEIGPHQVLWSLEEAAREADMDGVRRTQIDAFARELGWREFAHHLLHHFPDTPDRNLDRSFDAFAWRDDAGARERWEQGTTGIPIVDAGMRQLWRCGWMHNRVRMLVASLLTKNLLQHWRHGARWFWDTLVDADLANNTQGWQWTAGTGADAAPYFRIFNPVTQGERFDPEGAYVRRWVPELAKLPPRLVHRPWSDPDVLRACGYPAPVIDLARTRERALQAWRSSRASDVRTSVPRG